MIPVLKKSALRKAEWVIGKGQFASVATCRALWCRCGAHCHSMTVMRAAEKAKRMIDGCGCGGGCNGKSGHFIGRMPA